MDKKCNTKNSTAKYVKIHYNFNVNTKHDNTKLKFASTLGTKMRSDSFFNNNKVL